MKLVVTEINFLSKINLTIEATEKKEKLKDGIILYQYNDNFTAEACAISVYYRSSVYILYNEKCFYFKS